MHRVQRNWGARVHEYQYLGMRAVFLENEFLRIGVLADKGTDVFECNYKPKDIDFVWLTARGVRNPQAYLSTSPDPLSTFNDYYLGGWQEIFPNGGLPAAYAGVQFGQHGETPHLPWDYAIVEDDADTVAVRFTVRTQKTPFLLEKTLRLRSGTAILEIDETLTNESGVPLHAMWGHHLTFGRPFLGERARIILPEGTTGVADEGMIDATHRRVRPGETFTWPLAHDMDGAEIDLSVLPPRGTPGDVCYLTPPEGWYMVEDPDRGLAFRLEWDRETMPYIWFWQEFGATEGSPWFGRHYNIGLEPFSSIPAQGLRAAIANGTALLLGAHTQRTFTMRATIQPYA
jgi:Domain of unknown function (DUF4432)